MLIAHICIVFELFQSQKHSMWGHVSLIALLVSDKKKKKKDLKIWCQKECCIHVEMKSFAKRQLADSRFMLKGVRKFRVEEFELNWRVFHFSSRYWDLAVMFYVRIHRKRFSSFQAIPGIYRCLEDLLCVPRKMTRLSFELDTQGTKRGERMYLL